MSLSDEKFNASPPDTESPRESLPALEQVLREGPRERKLPGLQRLADACHQVYRARGLRKRRINPAWLAHLRGITVIGHPAHAVVSTATVAGKRVVWAPLFGDDELEVTCGVAKSLLRGRGTPADHVALAVLLLVEASALKLVSGHTSATAAVVLSALYPWLPTWVVRARLSLVGAR